MALTTRCNLACRYCYNGQPSKTEDMPEAVMQRALSLAAFGGEPFHLQLTGGEPALAPRLIERAAELARNAGCRSIGIQTNAICLTPDLLNLFKRYAVQVGVSLDGPPAVHEQQRGMAAQTLRGLKQLEEAGIPFRVTTVVTGANVLFLDRLVLTLAGFACARGIGLDPLVCKGRAKNGAVGPANRRDLVRGLQAMVAALDFVNAGRDVPIHLRERDLVASAESKQRKAYCHACLGESLAVLPDCRIFPCGQTMGDDRFEAGTVWQPNDEKLKVLRLYRLQHKDCEVCVLRDNCPGDCPSRLHYNKNLNPTLACDLYRTLWHMDQTKQGDNAVKQPSK